AYENSCSASISISAARLEIAVCLPPSKLWIDQSNCLMTRSRAVALQLFRTKSPDHLIAEAAAPERQMKRTLTAFDLTCIGIGAIIGTGIFALIGTAIAGQTSPTRLETPILNFIQAWLSGTGVLLGRAGAGPAVAISLFVAALACGFAALCYAELASMIPVSGSAYTYSYATLREISPCSIRWDVSAGYDAVSTTAEETKNPRRDMPIGIIASLIICTLLYVLMGTVLAGIKKYTVYLGDPAAAATAFASKPWAEALISAGALAGMTSVLLVFQLGQPRIFMAMARDGLLPQYFARIHPRFRTPYVTTIWTGVVVGGVAMLVDIGSLSDLTNIGTLFAFILVCVGVAVLRRTDAGRP